MTRPARLLVSATALRQNLRVAQSFANGARIYAVVKANAYGHGVVWAARILSEAGANAFAVACMEEAFTIREAGIYGRILLLEGAVDGHELTQALAGGFDLVVHRQDQAEALLRRNVVSGGMVWVKVDTGMGRLGMSVSHATHWWHQLSARLGGHKVGLMTHLANADAPGDPMTANQIAAFRSVAKTLPAAPLSALNSAGLLTTSGASWDWLRPGLMLYGACPVIGKTASDYGLLPVALFQSVLIDVKPMLKGSPIGYGGTAVLQRDSRIGVVAVGYGDGYPRVMAGDSYVRVGGICAPLIGRVSMDMLTVDLTDCPGASLGDTVLLWGDDLPVEQVAEWANTISYELLCRVTNRVRRVAVQ